MFNILYRNCLNLSRGTMTHFFTIQLESVSSLSQLARHTSLSKPFQPQCITLSKPDRREFDRVAHWVWLGCQLSQLTFWKLLSLFTRISLFLPDTPNT